MTDTQPTAPVLIRIPGITGTTEPAWELADPELPQLLVTDLGVTRGEGVFETVGVFDGIPQALEPHLDRLQRSADMLEMPALDRSALTGAVHAAIDAHADVPDLLLRIIVTPGAEAGAPGADGPTAWIHAKTSPDYRAERAGIRAVTLDRGIPSTAPQTSPWLLAGAKTLSYAINMAGLREAQRRGADEVLFVSSDGYVLEGPTSTLLVRRGNRFLTTPASAGVLPGTSQGAVFEALTAQGVECVEALMTPADVAASDGAWLLSSVRLSAPLTRLDDAELPVDRELSDRLNATISGRA